MTARLPKPAKTPELAVTEALVVERLAVLDFEGAARAVVTYEAKRPVPRGLGVDWSKYDPRDDMAALRSIYGRLQSDCAQLAEGAELAIRTAAALMYLFGVSKPYRRWLPREIETGMVFTGDQVSQALVSRAYAVKQNDAFDRARAMGVPIPDSMYRSIQD